MNYSMIRYILSRLLEFQAVFLALPCLIGLIYQEEAGFAYLWVLLGCLVLGWLGTRKKAKNITLFPREGFVGVVLGWMLLSLTGALPFFLAGEIPNYLNALFESMSGFSTTGSTILEDAGVLSDCSLFWRNFTQWIGGMGVLVLILAVLPLSGSHNIHLMKAESPGPSVGKLVPRIRYTARILYGIYFFMTVGLIVLLLISGMDFFSALCTGMGTAGTGGFGILNTNMASYPLASQIILTIFMILFGVNFNVYYLIFARKPKDALLYEEMRYYFAIIAVAVIFIVINGRHYFENIPMAIHQASFQVAAMISSTGYTTMDYVLWPAFSQTVLMALMFIGACAGSTGGGIKVTRVMVLLKLIKNETSYLLHPKRVRQIRMEDHIIPKEVLRGIQVFLLSYLLIFALSVLALSLNGFEFSLNFSAVLSTLNNMGPGFGKIGPMGNYGIFDNLSKGVLIFDMLAGRLEIFPILVFLTPSTWSRN